MKININQRKIKNYVTHKDIQLKIAFTNLAYMLAIIVVMIASILAPLYFETVESNQICNQIISGKIFVLIMDRFIFALFVIFLTGFLHQIFITHQFCGPIINFSNTLSRLSQGDFTRKIFLRKRDFLKEEAQQINTMIDKLTRTISDSRQSNQSVLSTLERISSDELSHEEIMTAVATARQEALRCRETLSCFSFAGKEEC